MKAVIALNLFVAALNAVVSALYFAGGKWGFGILWAVLAVVWVGIAMMNNSTRKIMDR